MHFSYKSFLTFDPKRGVRVDPGRRELTFSRSFQASNKGFDYSRNISGPVTVSENEIVLISHRCSSWNPSP